MANEKLEKAPVKSEPMQPAEEVKTEPQRHEPILPGQKRHPRVLNGKTSGAWRLVDHNGKTVHACEDADEAEYLFRMYSVSGEDEDGNGTFWKVLPHHPAKLRDTAWLAEQEAKKRLRR